MGVAVVAQRDGDYAVVLNPAAPPADRRAVVVRLDQYPTTPFTPVSAATLLTRDDSWEPLGAVTPAMLADIETVLAAGTVAPAGFDVENEPRDERGRWTEGGDAGTATAEPAPGEHPLITALREHAAVRDALDRAKDAAAQAWLDHDPAAEAVAKAEVAAQEQRLPAAEQRLWEARQAVEAAGGLPPITVPVGPGVDALLAQRTPRLDYLAEREAAMSRTVGDAAALNHMTVPEYQHAVEAHLAQVMADADVRVQVSPEHLADILRDGTFKTSFSVPVPEGRPGGYRNVRKTFEEEKLGIPRDAKPTERPVYGYLSNGGHQPNDVLTQYGTATVELKPDVKARTTFQWDDSMALNNSVPSPMGAPRWSSASYLRVDAGERTDPLHLPAAAAHQGDAYIEAQIHGTRGRPALTADDIGRVVFSAPPPPPLTAALDRAGIPHQTYRGNVEAYPGTGPVPPEELAHLEQQQKWRGDSLARTRSLLADPRPAWESFKPQARAELPGLERDYADAGALLDRYRRGAR